MATMRILNAFILLGLLFLPASYALAQDSEPSSTLELPYEYYSEPMNSFYFMKDDGEFSEEEKDKEALYIYGQCSNNAIQSIYFDCACIAGAFRAERDKEDLVPQSQIVSKLFNQADTPCANTIGIAGDAYKKCQSFTKTFRNRETEESNESYCTCVANSAAIRFSKKPDLNLRYIEKIKTNAMVSCRRTI